MHFQLRSPNLRLRLYFSMSTHHIGCHRTGTSEAAAVVGWLLVDGKGVEMIIKCPANGRRSM